jgi:hypothetical protein
MANNELKISSPEQVALELMRTISSYEDSDEKVFLKPNPRAYFLTLFQQCVKAGHAGRSLEDILKEGGGPIAY